MRERRDGGWVKQQRMNLIAAKISKALNEGAIVDLEKTVAWIEINIGLTEKRALSYIEKLAISFDWKIENGLISI